MRICKAELLKIHLWLPASGMQLISQVPLSSEVSLHEKADSHRCPLPALLEQEAAAPLDSTQSKLLAPPALISCGSSSGCLLLGRKDKEAQPGSLSQSVVPLLPTGYYRDTDFTQ